jgi:hypothetical protein
MIALPQPSCHNLLKSLNSFSVSLLDRGASQFLTEQLQVGLVGDLYNQVSGDSGSGDKVGSFESHVVGIGPQIGYSFPLGKLLRYLM